MKKFFLLLLFLLYLLGCKPSDLKLSSPNASINGSAKVNFNHELFLTASCTQCHEKKRPQTTPVHGNGADCISCHSPAKNAQGIRSWTSLARFDHSPAPTSCISCHDSKRPVTMAPHMPGQWGNAQDCASCHTFPNWKVTTFDHKPNLTSCVECHRNGTRDDRPLPVLSHPSNAYNRIDCVQCHVKSDNNQKWTDLTFNHRTHLPTPASCLNCHETKRPLSHINPSSSPGTTYVAGMDKGDCKSCHTSTNDWAVTAVFDHEAMKPTSCIGCHAKSTPSNQVAHPSAVGKYSSIDCAKCHTYDKSTSPRSWSKIVFNQHTHLPAPTSCVECHKTINNSLPVNNSHAADSRLGKDCVSCHKFDTLKPWKNFSSFNHNLLTSTERCDSCHKSSVTILKSKPANHIVTTLDCNSCHSSQAWKPASFVHSATDTSCSSCHDGTKATGKTATHISTTQECKTCHVNTAWKPATFVHSPSDTNCKSCHDGKTAKGRPQGHNLPMANQQCSSCHSQSTFATVLYNTTYKHSGAGGLLPSGTNYHKKQSSCVLCHSSTSDSVIYKNTAANASLSPKCAGCHTSDFAEGGSSHKKPISGSANCLSCHSYSGW